MPSRYHDAHRLILDAMPELQLPYERLVADWDNFDNQPPGQYIVFSDLLGRALEISLSLPARTPGREELLTRLVGLGEDLLTDRDDEIRGLGVDAVAETLQLHPAGRTLVERLGGPALTRWFKAYADASFEPASPDEIIDLWGVRYALVELLPETSIQDIPGISHPATYWAIESLEIARSTPEPVAILSAFGTTNLYVVAPASLVASDPHRLDELAEKLAQHLGGEEPKGTPHAGYFWIPRGERVWNMHRGSDRHSRLGGDVWIADQAEALADEIMAQFTTRDA